MAFQYINIYSARLEDVTCDLFDNFVHLIYFVFKDAHVKFTVITPDKIIYFLIIFCK